ncbi:MAG: hypothetical protein ACR2PT_12945 [Endozoicomonas sp.]
MESTVSRNQKKKTEDLQALYQWASQQLLAKGYSPKVVRPAITRALKHYRKQRLGFINWVHRLPPSVQKPASQSSRQIEFIKRTMMPKMVLLLKKKGYSQTASTRLSKLLIDHAGGPGKCDLSAVWTASKQWPEAQQ